MLPMVRHCFIITDIIFVLLCGVISIRKISIIIMSPKQQKHKNIMTIAIPWKYNRSVKYATEHLETSDIHGIHNIRNDRKIYIYLPFYLSLFPVFLNTKRQPLYLIFLFSGVTIRQNIKTLVFKKINTHNNNNINIMYLLRYIH